ncbi:hypothetical protein ACFWP5_13020 [Streptomyces sp. NPDC058469]|uniref:hypothetical protein n=1 Tax=Streptomyces sp. NPDC058469 TaxID=3346514 RepID=UPI0036665318
MHARDEVRPQDAAARRTSVSSPAVNTLTPSHELLSLQGKAGNAGVAQMLSEGGHSWAGRAADPAPAVQRAAVQRSKLAYGNISFTNVSLKYPESQGKATRILALLSANTKVKTFLADRTCQITLEKRTTETPANVVDKGTEGVFVTLASYYLENYDIGYIVGMLCHEFGMHPMAQKAPNMKQEEESFRGMPYPVPGLEGKDVPEGFASMNSDTAKQADHVLGVIPGSPRYIVYRDVTLEMADLLLRDVHNKADGARKQDVTDLIDCFLMDVASIAATNDDRTRGMPMPGNGEGETIRKDIAAVYNAYKARLSQDLPLERQPIKPLFPPEKTPEAVKADFSTLLMRIAKGKLWAWSIDNSK